RAALARRSGERDDEGMAGRDLESRIALAMLPLGVVLALASAIGFIAVAVLAVDMLFHPRDDARWWLGWCLVAAVGA
ncbi:hypothetical protein, partial [Enterococcus faecium]|uniref:hypothetical protein n=1 Tax=Enterococcus faecium TaxID=1352 RepID=UPI003F4227E2